jgi:hypothetical protein
MSNIGNINSNTNISLFIKENDEFGYISELDLLVLEYIESLSQDEKIAMNIAKQHLETSFCIEKSNGFINWKKKHKK